VNPVERSEIVDYQTYEEIRPEFRGRVLEEKERRRVHVGEHFTFLFENRLTVRYQVQEMMRTERMVRERDILHELDTYNELLGRDGELGATLLIEIESPEERTVKLRDWIALPGHVYAVLEDGSRVRACFDCRQHEGGRLSSVQYLRFPVGTRVPVAIGIDLPGIETEAPLTPTQQSALGQDIGVGPR
jgi:hypothetical protein